MKLYDQTNAGDTMYRDPDRDPPHNLLANAILLMDKDGKPRPPPALFTYRTAAEAFKGPKVSPSWSALRAATR